MAISIRCWPAPARSNSRSGANRCSTNCRCRRASRATGAPRDRCSGAGGARGVRGASARSRGAAAFLDAQGFRSIRARVTGEGRRRRHQDGIAPVMARRPAQPAPAPLRRSPPAPPIRAGAGLEAALDRWIAEATARQACSPSIPRPIPSIRCAADLVGVSLAIVPGRACYIPVRHDPAAKQGALDLGGTAASATRPS